MQALQAAFGSPDNVPDGMELRTDHGPQFTGNVVVERLIRTLEEQVIWSRDWDTVEQLREGVAAWVARNNERRPHQALRYKTPSEHRAQRLATPIRLTAEHAGPHPQQPDSRAWFCLDSRGTLQRAYYEAWVRHEATGSRNQELFLYRDGVAAQPVSTLPHRHKPPRATATVACGRSRSAPSTSARAAFAPSAIPDRVGPRGIRDRSVSSVRW